MSEIASAVFLVGGGFFAMIAGLGVLRLPDFLARTHAATKASGAALGLLLLAVVCRTPGWEVAIKAAVALGFAAATVPVAAHLLARSTTSALRAAAAAKRGEKGVVD
jgi:multicomponent Na+:H+ antiporter subunit G